MISDELLQDFDRAAKQRDADAVLVAMFVADGVDVPPYVVAKFHQSQAEFKRLAREFEAAAS